MVVTLILLEKLLAKSKSFVHIVKGQPEDAVTPLPTTNTHAAFGHEDTTCGPRLQRTEFAVANFLQAQDTKRQNRINGHSLTPNLNPITVRYNKMH